MNGKIGGVNVEGMVKNEGVDSSEVAIVAALESDWSKTYGGLENFQFHFCFSSNFSEICTDYLKLNWKYNVLLEVLFTYFFSS